MTMKKREQQPCTLPVPLKRALERFSEDTGVPMTRVLEKALTAYLKEKGAYHEEQEPTR